MLKMKHLLGLRDATATEIQEILDTALLMKVVITSNNKKTPHLQGRSIMTVFY